MALIDQQRGELELEAMRLGERLYVETPNAFVRRFEVYWRGAGRQKWIQSQSVNTARRRMQRRNHVCSQDHRVEC